MSDLHFDGNRLDGLIDTLLRLSVMEDRDARDRYVTDLAGVLGPRFDPERSAEARADVTEIVHSCATVSGGLRALARMMSQHQPGINAARLTGMIADASGPDLLVPRDRQMLRDILVDISIAEVAEAVGVLGDVPELRSLRDWRDMSAAIRVMERLPRQTNVPPLLIFVRQLAQIEGGAEADKLRAWLDVVSSALINAGVESRRENRPWPTVHAEPGGIAPHRADEPGLIWGNVPNRNRHFTGRVALLDRLVTALRTGSMTSVLPQTLQGMGGVGKTQLVVEFVYRHLHEYDLVWWIPAEQTATVLTSLSQLAERLGLSIAEDRQETARTVLDMLAGSDLNWLIVYDNAVDPNDLEQLIPSTGGHVIVTTRNQEWGNKGPSLEVDVFEREESIELLTNRSRDDRGNARIAPGEAEDLAETLGDLPLALEQAVAWYLATAMPISEYISLLDNHIKELLDEGKPSSYPLTVAAFVALAVKSLRESAIATAQLFSLFAYLGGEPVPVSLLRHGSKAEVSEPLRSTLGASIQLNRTVRELSRYGLAKNDALQRVQVHRLVQRVLRDTLDEEQRRTTQRDVRNLLAAANPGDPDEHGELARQRDMGPHIEPADLIHADNFSARQAVLDHTRYLWLSGDYENSRYLAASAADAWAADLSSPRLGPEGEYTLLARGQLANATRALGDSRTAGQVTKDTYERFRNNPLMGPEHEFTLITGNQVGHDLRIAGRYREALEFDQASLALHRAVFGPNETYTLRAQTNLGVDHRMVGDFAAAQTLDQEIANHWEDVGGTDTRQLRTYMNMARNYYGLGAYQAALERLERWRSMLQERLGSTHGQVLLAGRTYAITLRKAGRLAEALEVMGEQYERTHKRFGPNHEYSVAATASLGNVLRESGQPGEALVHLTEALNRYRADFGDLHPLTLVAQVNEAIIRRALGDSAEAQVLDQHCHEKLSTVLGPEHPYTICAGVSLATDYSRAGNHDEALALSRQMVEMSRASYQGGLEERGGAGHPYLLMRAVNMSHDLRATGATDEGRVLFEQSLAGLRQALGDGHPEVASAERGDRLEGDIEPPPT